MHKARQLRQSGYKLVRREQFMQLPVRMSTYGGATMSPEEKTRRYAAIVAKLRARATQFPGAWLVYDPHSDADGWLLVGDDPQQLVLDTLAHDVAVIDALVEGMA